MAAAMSLLIAILCATTAQLVVAFIARRPLGASLRGVRSWRDVTFIGTGWLPATPEGADFTADQVPAIVSANAFIDALAELPLATWLDIGRSLADGRPNSAARDAARASLTTAIHDCELDVAAWYVRDAVETCACLVFSVARTCSTHDRCAFDAARGAANDCALGFLAREGLASESLRALSAPFARAIELKTPSTCL
jgi:hypothetical protein